MNNLPTRPKGIYILPNLFTIAAIFAGFFAIVSVLKGNYENAAASIFIAMIMDALDGRIARLTNTMTSFGAEFDSMADMVSFAIAPALLAYSWGLYELGKFGWIIAFIYTVSVALRLARFNTQVDGTAKKFFQGLPSPSAAAVVASLVWVMSDLEIRSSTAAIILALTTLAVAILMVSNIRYHSFKDIELKNNVRFVVILILVVVIALISIDPEKVLFILFTSYATSGPITTIWGLRQKRRSRKCHEPKR